MKGKGPRSERETIIKFSEKEEMASIWTASERVYHQLLNRCYKPIEDGERHSVFEVPRREIKLPRPKRKRKMSEKQRQALRMGSFARKRHVNNESGEAETLK